MNEVNLSFTEGKSNGALLNNAFVVLCIRFSKGMRRYLKYEYDLSIVSECVWKRAI
jgi:hypothetical protein